MTCIIFIIIAVSVIHLAMHICLPYMHSQVCLVFKQTLFKGACMHAGMLDTYVLWIAMIIAVVAIISTCVQSAIASFLRKLSKVTIYMVQLHEKFSCCMNAVHMLISAANTRRATL